MACKNVKGNQSLGLFFFSIFLGVALVPPAIGENDLARVADKKAMFPFPIFPTTTPEKIKVLEEKSPYQFSRMKYNPPVRIIPLKSRDKASYNNPESTVIAYYSAMFNQDFEWFLSTWDKSAQEQILESEQRNNRSLQDRKEMWKEYYKGKAIYLTSRTESGPFIFIATKRVDSDKTPTKLDLDLPNVVHKVGGKWLLTHQHSRHPVSPVFRYWPNGERKRVKK